MTDTVKHHLRSWLRCIELTLLLLGRLLRRLAGLGAVREREELLVELRRGHSLLLRLDHLRLLLALRLGGVDARLGLSMTRGGKGRRQRAFAATEG